jgi:hypothetical protein
MAGKEGSKWALTTQVARARLPLGEALIGIYFYFLFLDFQ